jgi:Domain of unknown function (DUF4907)
MQFPQKTFFLAIFMLCLLSCGNEHTHTESDSLLPISNQTSDSVPLKPIQVSDSVFQVKDSLGHSKGWGYDLMINGKRVIHQDVIPARGGLNAFATESDAKKVAELAAFKFRTTGQFPTILLQELDSLGIK